MVARFGGMETLAENHENMSVASWLPSSENYRRRSESRNRVARCALL